MKKRLYMLFVAIPLFTACSPDTTAQATDETHSSTTETTQSDATLAVAQSFLQAAGSGDMETLSSLMADDFVWHNEGDPSVPWIGNWEGKQTVLETFLPAFGAGLKTTSWTTDYSFANGEQAVFMGTMGAIANNTGKSTGVMSWAVRVHVVGGKVMSWNWFEDSYAVSNAYQQD